MLILSVSQILVFHVSPILVSLDFRAFQVS